MKTRLHDILAPVNQFFAFNWIDKSCLALAISVLVLCSIFWIFLVLAAGSAPTGRLSAICLSWAAKAELLAVLPAWVAGRLAYSLYEILLHRPA